MSAISPVASSAIPSTRPETLEPPGPELKNDHDKDNVGTTVAAAAKAAAPQPTVNTQGQVTGTVLNTKA